jgi:hypothetical protein
MSLRERLSAAKGAILDGLRAAIGGSERLEAP